MQSVSPTIVNPGLESLESLTQLFESYRHFYGKDADVEGARDFLRKRIENGDSVIFMLQAETGEAIGFTQLYPLFSSTRMARIWLLNDLFIVESERGRGYSRLLVSRAKQHCRETGAVALSLETAKSNIQGNQLYPSEGFVLDEAYNHYEWKA